MVPACGDGFVCQTKDLGLYSESMGDVYLGDGLEKERLLVPNYGSGKKTERCRARVRFRMRIFELVGISTPLLHMT